MILRFINQKTGACINFDTAREEQSEEHVMENGKNYLPVSDEAFTRICCELDFNCYGFQKSLTVDGGRDQDLEIEALPFN